MFCYKKPYIRGNRKACTYVYCITFVSDFEDMSCEMIFGQQPPEDDPALKQPCFRTKCKPVLKHLNRFNQISN